MTYLWCIFVPFGAYFTVSGIPCFQCSKTKSRLHHRQTTLCVRGNICLYETKRIYEGYEKSSENCTSNSHLGLNIPIKLNETLIELHPCNSFRENRC